MPLKGTASTYCYCQIRYKKQTQTAYVGITSVDAGLDTVKLSWSCVQKVSEIWYPQHQVVGLKVADEK